MTESPADPSDEPTFSEEAEMLLEQHAGHESEPVLQMLNILVRMMECQVVTLWNIEEALDHRTVRKS